jgi:hypothetical protein
MASPHLLFDQAAALAAFHTDEPLKHVAERLRTSKRVIRRLWKDSFGEESFSARCQKNSRAASPEALKEAVGVFHTDEPFRRVAKRLGISPGTLRQIWIEEYGRPAFDERGRKIQLVGATAFNRRKKETQCSSN